MWSMCHLQQSPIHPVTSYQWLYFIAQTPTDPGKLSIQETTEPTMEPQTGVSSPASMQDTRMQVSLSLLLSLLRLPGLIVCNLVPRRPCICLPSLFSRGLWMLSSVPSLCLRTDAFHRKSSPRCSAQANASLKCGSLVPLVGSLIFSGRIQTWQRGWKWLITSLPKGHHLWKLGEFMLCKHIA